MVEEQYNTIKACLLKVKSGSVSTHELTLLVQISRALIQSHLNHLRNSLLMLCRQNGLSVTDLAYDCIAEAFAKNSQNEFPILNNFISSLQGKIEHIPTHEIFLAYKSFITTIAEAQLARLYAQSDPMGAKINRNLKEGIKNSELFTLAKDFRGTYLTPRGMDALNHLPSFPREQLEIELLNIVNHQQTTPKLLECLRQILESQSNYRRSVLLNDVVQISKKVFQGSFQGEEQIDYQKDLESLTDYEIDTLCTQVEYALKEKIVLTYLARGKINRKEAEGIYNAFHDLIDDWIEGIISNYSLFEYVTRYIACDEETYEAQYRPKIEYLLKIVRQEFAARLLKEI